MGEPQLCVVTGASAGIGRETARGMAERGYSVVVVGRNPDKTESAEGYVRDHLQSGAQASSICCDFSSQAQVRELADKLLAACPHIDVLINNAGLWNKTRRLGPDDIESTLAVNHLAPYLLTRLLLPRLLDSAPSRIVHVSSRLHEKQKLYDFDDMQFISRYPGRGIHAYSQTKLANVMFSNELAVRLVGTGVTSNSVHPGDLPSEIVRDSPFLYWGGKLVKPFFDSPEEASRTSIHVATDPGLSEVSGHYFKKCRQTAASPAALDRSACERLWNLSAELVGLPASLS